MEKKCGIGQCRRKRKCRTIPFLCVVLSCFFLGLYGQGAEAREQETVKQEPQENALHSKAAVLMDADSGRVLYGKNEEDILPMASTTKIMTCIVALENGNPEDIVTVSSYAASQPKVHLGMRKGQQFVLRDLFYSMMLESHNDAAVAIAEHIGAKLIGLPEETERSSEDSKKAVHAFTELMNQKARDLGCFDTCFVTPNGLDAAEAGETGRYHSTTAKDLAAVMRYCIKQSAQKEQFLEITRTLDYAFNDVSGKYRYSCRNHNAFLTMMDGAVSGKTGFTGAAGYCYVGALERDGKCFTAAFLACGWPNHKTWKWNDARLLFSYGLDAYSYHTFSEKPLPEEWKQPIAVKNGRTEILGDTAYTSVRVADGQEKREGLLLREGEEITVECQMKKELEAPVQEGEEAGRIVYRVNGELFRMDLIETGQTVEAVDLPWCMEQVFWRFLPG